MLTPAQQCEYAAWRPAPPGELERLPEVVDYTEGVRRQAVTVAVAAAAWSGEHLQPNGDR